MTWPTATLGELSKGAGQYGVGLSSREWRVGDPRYIRITDIDDQGRLNSSVVAPDGGRSDWEKAILQEGDLLFARSGATVGKTYLHGADAPPAVYAGYLIRFQLDTNRALPDYVFRFTQGAAYRAWVASSQRAVAQPNINAKQYASLPIPLPPLDQQRRIAAILDQADGIRGTTQCVVDRLTKLPESVFMGMFGSRPEASLESVSAVCDRITVGVVVKPASYYVDSGVPALRTLNVKPGFIDESDLVYFSQEANDGPVAKSKLRQGDVVVSRTGRAGVAAVVPKHLVGANAIDLIIISPRSDRVDSQYLEVLLNSPIGTRLVAGEQRGQIQQHFNVGSLKAAKLPIPELRKQQEFAERVKRTRAVLDSACAQVREVDELFSSLQSRAFSGQL